MNEYDSSYNVDPNLGSLAFPLEPKEVTIDCRSTLDQAQLTERLRDSIRTYVSRCQEVMECDIDRRILDHLWLIPEFWPYRYIVVGQSPYDSKKLPRYASAFAFDSDACPGFTPSVQVFAQFVTLHNEADPIEVASVLSCSYVLMTAGVLMINALPYVTDNSVINMKLSSFTSELLIEIVLCSNAIMKQSTTVLKVGSIAQRCVDDAVGAIPHSRRAEIRLKAIELAHPAGIARQYKSNKDGIEVEPSSYCREINRKARGNVRVAYDRIDDWTRKSQTWVVYPKKAIEKMGSQQLLQKFIKVLTDTNVEQESVEFFRVAARTMADRGQNKGAQGGQQPRHETWPQEQKSYTERVLDAAWQNAVTVLSAWEQDRKTFLSAIQCMEETPTPQTYEDVLASLDGYAVSVRNLAIQVKSVHTVLLSGDSAIASAQGNVQPFVRGGLPRDLVKVGYTAISTKRTTAAANVDAGEFESKDEERKPPARLVPKKIVTVESVEHITKSMQEKRLTDLGGLSPAQRNRSRFNSDASLVQDTASETGSVTSSVRSGRARRVISSGDKTATAAPASSSASTTRPSTVVTSSVATEAPRVPRPVVRRVVSSATPVQTPPSATITPPRGVNHHDSGEVVMNTSGMVRGKGALLRKRFADRAK